MLPKCTTVFRLPKFLAMEDLGFWPKKVLGGAKLRTVNDVWQ